MLRVRVTITTQIEQAVTVKWFIFGLPGIQFVTHHNNRIINLFLGQQSQLRIAQSYTSESSKVLGGKIVLAELFFPSLLLACTYITYYLKSRLLTTVTFIDLQCIPSSVRPMGKSTYVAVQDHSLGYYIYKSLHNSLSIVHYLIQVLACLAPVKDGY